jgi:hypothetical protein
VRRLLLVVTLCALTTRAHAEPDDMIRRPFVLDVGQVNAELVTEINVGHGGFGKPISLAPDVWVGVLPRLTLGLIHSNPSVDRFSPGATFCVRHLDIRCDTTYHGSGVDVRWGALAGDLEVVPRLRVLVRELDPFKPAVTLGALVRWRHGRYAITGDPYLQLGLANTDQGNRHALFLPVQLSVQPRLRWEVVLRTGWHSDLAVIRDGWHVPVAIGTRARATAHIDVGAMLGFSTLLGPQNTAKERAVFLLLAYRS